MDLKRLLQRLGLIGTARFVLVRLLVVQRALVHMGLLEYATLRRGTLVQMGNAALARGRHALAMETYTAALAKHPEDLSLRRQIGVTAFLAGQYGEAEKWFASSEQTRHFDMSRWGLSEIRHRVLDRSWLLAIGHVAFLDTHIKTVRLGWLSDERSLLAYNPNSPPSGWPLFRYFSEYLQIVADPLPEAAIDRAVHGPDFADIDISARDQIRAALAQPFWYGPDAAGRTRWFAPYGAAVEAAWKEAGHGPLLDPGEADRGYFRRTMREVYGLPEDAWFVLLHVREPGYHAQWHRHHPGTRNADISTYQKVIDFIVAQGGWVVRGGDPTMQRIPAQERVIDYATSTRRSPEIDVLLCAECRYFVGTNSGFSVLPPVFGKRCALTNWSPIGITNWYLDDIYIPKLVRRRGTGRPITFTEMFSSFAGWSQFERDFRKTDLSVEDNDPDDLLAAVEELHAEVLGSAPPVSPADAARLQRFNEIAVAHGGYVGSRMSYRFLAKYPHLLD